MADEQTSTKQTTWLTSRFKIKTGLFVIALALLGVLGWYDASIKYPARGQDSASYLLREYLEKANQHGYMLRTSVADPAGELDSLKPRRGELIKAAESEGVAGAQAQFDLAKMNWLEALSYINKLDAANTTFDNPHGLRDELNDVWGKASAKVPKPLKAYDIPVQWIIMGVGAVGALLLLLNAIIIGMKKYHWDPETKTLTIPGGASFTPSDLADVDKRKWDKFLVFCSIKKSHPQLGGKEIKFDVYRYEPLEAWILEMEAEAFPDRVEEQKGEEAAELTQAVEENANEPSHAEAAAEG
ncbi:MAG: hypothetical protein H6815_03650 [Phycisphaeraceae bacterium]|nr:hypothetical protein [Phycisphaerales bacterium]MCB9859523.1 hypothetical protein [Phycisphaeraceae bacterium]